MIFFGNKSALNTNANFSKFVILILGSVNPNFMGKSKFYASRKVRLCGGIIIFALTIILETGFLSSIMQILCFSSFFQYRTGN